MRQIILSSVVLGILMAVTGCSASRESARMAATPTSNVADTSRDPSWTPPDEWSFTTTEEARKSPSNAVAGVLPSPNRLAIARGQLHAAY